MTPLKLTLIRSMFTDQGVFGKLYLPNGTSLFSGEEPDREDKANISCIPSNPAGYPVDWAFSPHRGRNCYHIRNVPGRDGILMHSANFMGDRSMGYRSDLEGCIALGSALGMLAGQRALTGSQAAIKIFEDLLAQKPFTLCINVL